MLFNVTLTTADRSQYTQLKNESFMVKPTRQKSIL